MSERERTIVDQATRPEHQRQFAFEVASHWSSLPNTFDTFPSSPILSM